MNLIHFSQNAEVLKVIFSGYDLNKSMKNPKI